MAEGQSNSGQYRNQDRSVHNYGGHVGVVSTGDDHSGNMQTTSSKQHDTKGGIIVNGPFTVNIGNNGSQTAFRKEDREGSSDTQDADVTKKVVITIDCQQQHAESILFQVMQLLGNASVKMEEYDGVKNMFIQAKCIIITFMLREGYVVTVDWLEKLFETIFDDILRSCLTEGVTFIVYVERHIVSQDGTMPDQPSGNRRMLRDSDTDTSQHSTMAITIQRLQVHLSCIICTELYRDPCTLVCGHTFCKGCLTQYTKTQPDAIRAKSLLCPTCKQMTKVSNSSTKVEDWLEQFKPNVSIQGLLEDLAFRATVVTAPVDNPCSTCLQHGDRTPASSYCTDCEMAICKKCVKAHHAIPATANHLLSDVRGGVTGSMARTDICKTHNSIMKFYCKDCHKAVCQKCCILYHRKGDNVVTIESMMPEMKSLLNENRDMLSQQLERIETGMKTMETKINEIEGRKVQTLAEIKKVSEIVINLVCQKEKQLMNELEDITGKQIADLRRKLKSGESDIQINKQHREFIDQALISESKMNICDIYQKCQSGAITTVSDMETQINYTSIMNEITFGTEFAQHSFDKNLQLGRIMVQKNVFDPQCTPTLVEALELIAKNDKVMPNPIDITFLDVDGIQTLLVTDMDKKCLKSFYTRDQQPRDSSLSLSSEPWNVTRLTHNQVVVSYIDHNQITLVKVTPDLVLLSNITTQKKYTGLTALNATAIVAGCRDPPSLDIIDLKGHVQRSIRTDSRVIQAPSFLSTTSKGNILVSDGRSNTVLCLTPEGDVIFTYSPSGDRKLRGSRGITTSTTGDILVADWSNNKVIQLTPTGDFVRDLLTSHDGIDGPYSICLHKDKLYVVQNINNLMKVFRVN